MSFEESVTMFDEQMARIHELFGCYTRKLDEIGAKWCRSESSTSSPAPPTATASSITTHARTTTAITDILATSIVTDNTLSTTSVVAKDHEVTISTPNKPSTTPSALPTASPASTPAQNAAIRAPVATPVPPLMAHARCSTISRDLSSHVLESAAVSSASSAPSSTPAPAQDADLGILMAATEQAEWTHAGCSTSGLCGGACVLMSSTTPTASPVSPLTSVPTRDANLAIAFATTKLSRFMPIRCSTPGGCGSARFPVLIITLAITPVSSTAACMLGFTSIHPAPFVGAVRLCLDTGDHVANIVFEVMLHRHDAFSVKDPIIKEMHQHEEKVMCWAKTKLRSVSLAFLPNACTVHGLDSGFNEPFELSIISVSVASKRVEELSYSTTEVACYDEAELRPSPWPSFERSRSARWSMLQPWPPPALWICQCAILYDDANQLVWNYGKLDEEGGTITDEPSDLLFYPENRVVLSSDINLHQLAVFTEQTHGDLPLASGIVVVFHLQQSDELKDYLCSVRERQHIILWPSTAGTVYCEIYEVAVLLATMVAPSVNWVQLQPWPPPTRQPLMFAWLGNISVLRICACGFLKDFPAFSHCIAASWEARFYCSVVLGNLLYYHIADQGADSGLGCPVDQFLFDLIEGFSLAPILVFAACVDLMCYYKMSAASRRYIRSVDDLHILGVMVGQVGCRLDESFSPPSLSHAKALPL